ncbi:hypothetical protein ACI65C_000130, partial [Semiaphis heraclei]
SSKESSIKIKGTMFAKKDDGTGAMCSMTAGATNTAEINSDGSSTVWSALYAKIKSTAFKMDEDKIDKGSLSITAGTKKIKDINSEGSSTTWSYLYGIFRGSLTTNNKENGNKKEANFSISARSTSKTSNAENRHNTCVGQMLDAGLMVKDENGKTKDNDRWGEVLKDMNNKSDPKPLKKENGSNGFDFLEMFKTKAIDPNDNTTPSEYCERQIK